MQSEALLRTTLGAICEQQGGGIQTGPFGSQLHASDYAASGTPVVMPADIVGGRVSTAAIARVGIEHVERLSQHQLRLNDIVFSRRGDVTRFARVTEREVGWLCGTGCLKVRIGTGTIALPEWIAIALGAPEVKDWLVRHAVGATMPNLNTSILGAVPLRVPPIEQQREAVEVCFALDDRIDLLRQTNATLESIAQALFKSWFIDFDPVRAKAEGREPEGMDAATAALFPAEFEESETGLLPKAWTAQPFGALLAHAIGGDWGSETETTDFSLPATIIRGTDIPDIAAGRYQGVPRRFVSPRKAVKRILHDGDLAIEVSGGSKTQPTGRSLYLSRDLIAKLGDTVVPTSFCRLFRAKDSQTALVLARHLAHIYGIGKMWNYQVQSTGLANFQTQHFLDSEMVVVAPSVVFEKFFELVRPLVDRIYAAPIAELEAMRDALLPRLISGKLRLPEAQAQLEEAIA